MKRSNFLKMAGSGMLGISSIPVLAGASEKSEIENHDRKDVTKEGKGAQRLTDKGIAQLAKTEIRNVHPFRHEHIYR